MQEWTLSTLKLLTRLVGKVRAQDSFPTRIKIGLCETSRSVAVECCFISDSRSVTNRVSQRSMQDLH